MATQAEEALASETYNPSRSPDVIALYNLMTTTDPSEALMDQYREVVTSMTTENPYEGVLFNPRACEIDQANNDIGEIIDDLKDTDVSEDITDALEEVKDQLDEYKEHTDRLIANLPTISSVVQSEIGNNTSGQSNSGVSGNPCLGFADIMGSILDQGQSIMNDIMSAIANVKENVGAAEDLVKNAVTQLQAKIAAAMTQLQDEVTKLASAMLNMSKMNLAQLMKFTNNDPCLKQIMSGVLTGAAQNVLGG
jgi:gas vesicle protein